jgi:hypothetical protein
MPTRLTYYLHATHGLLAALLLSCLYLLCSLAICIITYNKEVAYSKTAGSGILTSGWNLCGGLGFMRGGGGGGGGKQLLLPTRKVKHIDKFSRGGYKGWGRWGGVGILEEGQQTSL